MYNPNSGKYEQGWRPVEEDKGLIHHGGTGRWQDIENTITGERSLKEHTLKTVWESCPKGECYFEITDAGKREATCKKCKFVTRFIVGIDVLKDGKFSKK
jgi:hypothetical protein